MEKLVVVWLGWGGYTAAMYASRYALDPVLIGETDGGLIIGNPMVENFPWIPWPVGWYEIMDKMRKQAEDFKIRIVQDRVKSILPIDPNDFKKWFKLTTWYSWDIETKSLVLALWTDKVKIGVPGEKELYGKGVSYCATCDGFFYRWKTAVVVWWWDTAMIEALYLSDICQKVYLIHRRNDFRWEATWMERVRQKANIEILTPTVITEIYGEKHVNGISISTAIDATAYADAKEFRTEKLDVDVIFIAIWNKPNTIAGLDEYLQKDELGYIVVDKHQMTSVPWVFAAGDFTNSSARFRQLIVACWEWAVAAEWAFQYVSKN